ncbi:hypothetical protein F5Y15DRAFT_66092 [Xylariaceae sp. FL0016]|nr:hypothetical protein F5Y15DRAFT_66092 [Xylariaceae sp. FL0016]
MSNVPVVPLEGHIPDFDGHTYLQTILAVVSGVSFGIATTLLALRLYTSAVIVRKFVIDDPLVIAAWGVSLAFLVCIMTAYEYGFGKHLYDVSQLQILGYYDLLLPMALTYIWPPTLVKLAMLSLYYRINPWLGFRISLYITAGAIITYTVILTIFFAGPCNPQRIGSGVCLNNLGFAQSALNIVSDLVIVLLPVRTIHRLRMPLKRKITVGAVLAIGSAVVLASIARVSYIKVMSENPDITWTQASAAVWGSLELNLGVICNCLVSLMPFVRRHLPRVARLLGDTSSGPSAQRGSSKANPRAWCGEHSSGNYRLHSIDDREDVVGETRRQKPSAAIHVVEQWDVEVERARPVSKKGSTDSILGLAQ